MNIISYRAKDWDRERFFVVHLDDGRILNEHQVGSWANVPIHKVVTLQVRICGKHWSLDRNTLSSKFQEFIYFCSALSGMGSHVRKMATGEDETISRTIGWTDGEREYLLEIDERTGKKLRSYVVPAIIHRHHLSKFKSKIQVKQSL